MNTDKKDITVQLIEFMIEKYYEVIHYNVADQNILVE